MPKLGSDHLEDMFSLGAVLSVLPGLRELCILPAVAELFITMSPEVDDSLGSFFSVPSQDLRHCNKVGGALQASGEAGKVAGAADTIF
jgi:hypothetical protein